MQPTFRPYGLHAADAGRYPAELDANGELLNAQQTGDPQQSTITQLNMPRGRLREREIAIDWSPVFSLLTAIIAFAASLVQAWILRKGK